MCCGPFFDERRISVKEGDLIQVTNQSSHWLYGEKVVDRGNGEYDSIRPRQRGWFPKTCVSDLQEDKDD